ncbi:MAG: hypothetical protein CO093_01310 [Alphaproteobacteria bacterium CG_4_9_14_3_um_filter_47_13]|nr:MAG: hypothetical protein CO093_01310 [Alphaproteobacteria bacterium CG_4_9_14_3_um_filter_47_13]
MARQPEQPPALIITSDPLPLDLRNKVYSKPSVAPQTTAQKVMGMDYYNDNGTDTVVGRKIDNLRKELFSLQGNVANFSEKLAALELNGQTQAAEYYASVATISTQLQSGTTPGNPRLVNKMNVARENLEWLSGNIASLNALAGNISDSASMASFLLDSARTTYSLSGAIEEDHVRLAQLEDAINNTVVIIERMLNNVNDDITRTTAYLATERNNLRTLSLAINTGDMFGKSLSNRPFSNASQATFTPVAASSYGNIMPQQTGMMPPATMENASFPGNADPRYTGVPPSPRPLVKIRFDRPDVAYQQPVYMAVNEALARYPNARFELVAVHPSTGNAAEVAIESTRARRNAERVLRSLTEMGLSLDHVDLSYMPSGEATTNEVHLYVR